MEALGVSTETENQVIHELYIVREQSESVTEHTEAFTEDRRYLFIKRIMDILCSCLALIALLPVFVITAAAIWIEDGGPVIFSQERIGKGEVHYQMYKFRSMRKNAPELHEKLQQSYQGKEEITFKMKDDPRVTKVGRIIRKTSIDELPQLINIIKGDMSIVGPRPLPTYEYGKIKGKYRERYWVKQGLTCYWQVSGRSNIEFEKRMQMDMQYVKDASIKLDIKLIFKTFKAIVSGEGAY